MLLIANLQAASAGVSSLMTPISEKHLVDMNHNMADCCEGCHDFACLASCLSPLSSHPALSEAIFIPSTFAVISRLSLADEKLQQPEPTSLYFPPIA